MKKELCQLLLLLCGYLTTAQTCPALNGPLEGDSNVPVNTSISWNPTTGIQGYFLTVGTALGLRDIVDRKDMGLDTFYTPPLGLPENTTIYVKITLYFSVGPVIACSVQEFTTGAADGAPNCTALTSPANGATNVPLASHLEWAAVPNAIGYRVSVGTSPMANDVLDGTFSANTTSLINFAPNSTFHVTLVPFNSHGDALGCLQESFSTSEGCGPFLDPISGEQRLLSPEINFPDQIKRCLGDIAGTVTTNDLADGFRWYKLEDDGTETLISNAAEVDFLEEGRYRYEAFNTIEQGGNIFECSDSKEFTVVFSEMATITGVTVSELQNGMRIEIQVTGTGAYEYSLDNGNYQNDPIFENVSPGVLMVYVRDKNGCGVQTVQVGVLGYPRFFSPNGDSINDYWQVGSDSNLTENTTVSIYDRYGKLLKQLDPNGAGWDGTYKNTPLPASDYWFRVVVPGHMEFKGHFALKR